MQKGGFTGADIALPNGAAGVDYSVGAWEAKKGEKAKWQQTAVAGLLRTVPAVHGEGAGAGGELLAILVPFHGTAPIDPAEQICSPRTTPGCRWPHALAAPLPPPAEGSRSSRQKPRVLPPALRDRPGCAGEGSPPCAAAPSSSPPGAAAGERARRCVLQGGGGGGAAGQLRGATRRPCSGDGADVSGEPGRAAGENPGGAPWTTGGVDLGSEGAPRPREAPGFRGAGGAGGRRGQPSPAGAGAGSPRAGAPRPPLTARPLRPPR